jgi:hypothetical protein
MSKYTLEYLKSLLDKDNAKLVGDYEILRRRAPIKFICKCGNENTKQLQSIIERNALCHNCTMINRYEKTKETRIKLYNNIINEKSLEAIIKKNKERSVLTKEKWNNIENSNILKCRTCNKEKSLDNYPKRRDSLYNQWETECNECKTPRKRNEEHKRISEGTLEYNLGLLLKNTNQRTKKKNKETLINIDIDYLKEIYNKQDGLCFYSGKKMSFIPNSREKMSIDRINSNKWYEKGNVVLCCWTANNLKQDLSIDEFKDWINSINNIINK